MIIDDFSNPKRKLTVSEASAANDYFTRRKSEEDRIAGTKAPAKNKKNPANTDYAKKRKQQDVDESFGRRPDHGREERHDLDPTDWYIVKDGKMFAASIYPRQVKQAEAEGFSRTKAEARARAGSQGVAEDTTDDLLNMRRDDPRIKQNQDITALAKEIYAQMVAERGQPMDRRQQQTWMAIAQTKAAAQLSNTAAQNESQGMAEGKESPEKEIERLKLRQDAEHGHALLRRQAATQARIRELEKQIKGKKSVAEGFNDTDTVFLTPNTGSLAGLRYNTFKDASPEEHKKAIQHHSTHADRRTPRKAAFHDMRAKMHHDWLSGKQGVAEAAPVNTTPEFTQYVYSKLRNHFTDLAQVEDLFDYAYLSDVTLGAISDAMEENGTSAKQELKERLTWLLKHMNDRKYKAVIKPIAVEWMKLVAPTLGQQGVAEGYDEYAGSDNEEARMYDAGEFGDDYRDEMDEARMSAAQRLSNAWDRQRAKSNASLARTPSSIPKKEEPKKADPVPKTVSEHRTQRRALMAQMLNSH